MKAVLGIDVGGSGIKGVPVNLQNGHLMGHRHRLETPQPATPNAVAETIEALIQTFDWKGPVGCTMPSIVKEGVLKSAANIPAEWINTDAQKLFEDRTGLPFKVLNDADAAGIGELHFGAAGGRAGTVILLTVGTGIGSALFRDGVLIPNTEFGHLKFGPNIAEKYCGDRARKEQKLKWEGWATRFNE